MNVYLRGHKISVGTNLDYIWYEHIFMVQTFSNPCTYVRFHRIRDNWHMKVVS